MKKVVLYAYTKQNLGDDLFIKILCDRYPNTKFFIYAPKIYKNIFKDVKNLKIYSSEFIIYRIINWIFRKLKINNIIESYLRLISDAGVRIGGSLFIQGDNWEKYTEDYIEPMKSKRKPFFLIGINFGPFEDERYFLKHKKIFSNYTDICFREDYSYNLFHDLPNVRLADDIIFSIGEKRENENSDYVFISVIKPSYRKELAMLDDIYYEKIKELILGFIENGLKVYLVSFCEAEGDEEAVRKIYDALPVDCRNKVFKEYYKTNIERQVELISNSKLVIASRFHAMILGFCFNKNVLPLIYSSKMSNVLQDIKFKGLSYDIKNIDQLEYSNVKEFLNEHSVDVSQQIRNSNEHFKYLDMFLNYRDQDISNNGLS